MRKHVFGHMRTAKAQISLRVRAVWSGPSLSANRFIGYYRMFEWRAKARMTLCACAGWSESVHVAHVECTFSIDIFTESLSTSIFWSFKVTWSLLIDLAVSPKYFTKRTMFVYKHNKYLFERVLLLKAPYFSKTDISLSKKVLINWYIVLIQS